MRFSTVFFAVIITITVIAVPVLADMPSKTQWKLFETVEQNYGMNAVKCTNMSGVPEWLFGTKWDNAFGGFGGIDRSGKEPSPWTWNYLFDCTSAVYKLEIDGPKQQATFSVRLTPTENYNDSYVTEKTKPPFRSFGGTTPGFTFEEKIHTLATLLGTNFVVNMWHFTSNNTRYFASISDQAGESVIDPYDLDYAGTIPFDDPLNNRFAVLTSSHPVQPALSKYIYRYHTVVFGDITKNITDVNAYVLHRQSTEVAPGARPVREPIVSIPVAAPSYIHSFPVSAQQRPGQKIYMLMMQYPLKFNIAKIVLGTKILPAMEWQGNKGVKTLITLVEIDDATGKGRVAYEREIEPLFAYHFISGYFDEYRGVFVADLCAFPNADHLQTFELNTLRNHTFKIPPTHLSRFEIPVSPVNNSLYNETKAEINLDLPRYNLKYTGLPMSFVYSVGADSGDWYSQLYKVDLRTQERIAVWKRDEFWPSEPLFIEAPNAQAEDDGVVISTVLDGPRGVSFLLILNATNFTQIGFIDLEMRLPFPSHGLWDNGAIYDFATKKEKPATKEDILGSLRAKH